MVNNLSSQFLIDFVRARVSDFRFGHIQRVSDLARDIALANKLNPQDAYLAGLLHDVAKEFSVEELLELAQPQNQVEKKFPSGLHGRVGSIVARSLGVENEDILEAIEWHVFGVLPGHRLGMAVFVADFSEPGRGWGDKIRETALHGKLGEAYRMAVFEKYQFLTERGKEIHPRLLELIRYYQDQDVEDK